MQLSKILKFFKNKSFFVAIILASINIVLLFKNNHNSGTEKRIFVLSINEYPTKEIAGLLGLTSQYVNNARSSIRKKMGIEDNWKEVLLNKKNPNLRSSE